MVHSTVEAIWHLSGLELYSPSFLRHAFRQFLKVLSWIRKPESLILDKKTGKSYLR